MKAVALLFVGLVLLFASSYVLERRESERAFYEHKKAWVHGLV